MVSKRIIYTPFSALFLVLLVLILLVIVSILFMGLVSTAFVRLGFSWSHAFLLLLFSLIGSSVNVPIGILESKRPIITEKYISFFGMRYKLPVIQEKKNRTVLSINIGGAVIPIIVSLYLIWTFPQTVLICIAGIAIVSLITWLVARPVRGVGIVTPIIVPPLAAVVSSLILISLFHQMQDYIFIVAYTSGTIGTLLGADIFNLRSIRDLGAPVASIGGAGTFDGVFLTGIIAVIIV